MEDSVAVQEEKKLHKSCLCVTRPKPSNESVCQEAVLSNAFLFEMDDFVCLARAETITV